MDPLITTVELEEYLQRAIPAEQADLAVTGASGIVRTRCRWDISEELGATFKLDGSGSRVLSLPSLLITDVMSVSVDAVPLDMAEVRWSRRGQLYRLVCWPAWSAVEVVADSGYAVIPDVIRLVSLSVAARIISNPEALRSATVGSVQRTWGDTSMNSVELCLLDQYRLP